jgi:hypothetical protein
VHFNHKNVLKNFQGRVVALPHEQYIATDNAEDSLKKFIENAITWLAKKAEVKIAADENIAVSKYRESLTILAPKDLAGNKEINVYYFMAHTEIDEEGVKAILDFIENGGGLLVAGQCSPCYNTPGFNPQDFPGNKYKIDYTIKENKDPIKIFQGFSTWGTTTPGDM